MWSAPARHAGKLNSVCDDVVNLAVAEVLRLRREQIRHPGIEILPNLRRATSIGAMANRAAGNEMFAGFFQSIWCSFPGILFATFASRDRKIPDGSGHNLLEKRRLRFSAEASPDQESRAEGGYADDREKYEKQFPQDSHRLVPFLTWTWPSTLARSRPAYLAETPSCHRDSRASLRRQQHSTRRKMDARTTTSRRVEGWRE